MNVVPREKPINNKRQSRNKKDLLIKDTNFGNYVNFLFYFLKLKMLSVVSTVNLTLDLCFNSFASFVIIGIRGASVLPVALYNTYKVTRSTNSIPRYQFNNEEPSTSKKNSMGPPLGVPFGPKRRLVKTVDFNYEQDISVCPC